MVDVLAKTVAPQQYAARRNGWLRATIVALLLTTGASSSVLAQAEPIPAYEIKLTNIERAVSMLAREYANADATLEKRALQRRLIDLRIAFEMGNYQTAAILAFDAFEEPRFTQHRDYFTTTMVLAEALFKLGNTQGASRYFEIVTKAPSARLADRARGYLIDMALNANDYPRLKVLIRSMAGSVEENTRYAIGKAHIRLGEYKKALGSFNGIGISSDKHFLARYYAGVALTAQKKLDQALAVFTVVGRIQARNGGEEMARDLANLAAGRLLMERNETTKAVTAYQRIGRYSPSYDVALYEMAWAYIKNDDNKRAMRAVDILLLVVEDEQMAVEAYVLRGRLSILISDYDGAVDSYEQILERFAPIRNELDRFTAEPSNIDGYFEWLLDRHRTKVEATGPLTPKTARWVASAKQFGRIVGVFDKLSEEAGEIRETKQLADELERIVSASNRVERFPVLKDGWTRALALQDGLIALSTALLEHEFRSKSAGSADAQVLKDMRAQRQTLEQRWRKVPKTIEAYRQRRTAVGAEYADLDRKAFLIDISLKQVREQLGALEKFINKKQFADSGDKMTAAREREMRAAITKEKTALTALYDQLTATKREISVESQTLGTGDRVTQGEAAMRISLIRAHRQEAALYERLGGAKAKRVADMLRRIDAGINVLANTIGQIDRKVGEKVASLVKIIAEEKARLAGYDIEMGTHENSGRRIARAVGERLFDDARRRMQGVVLEADVGLIDVAWQKKQRKTGEIRDLQQDRSKRLQAVNSDAERLLREAGGGSDDK